MSFAVADKLEKLKTYVLQVDTTDWVNWQLKLTGVPETGYQSTCFCFFDMKFWPPVEH